jgi:hypothetical protein
MARKRPRFTALTQFFLVLVFCATINMFWGNGISAHAEVLFVGDFEHGPIPLTRDNPSSPWYSSGKTPTVVKAPEPVRHGTYAVKSVLDRQENPGCYRAEIVPKNMVFGIGKEYWIGFSTYIPNDWEVDTKSGGILWQVHGQPDLDVGEDWRNPVLAWCISGETSRINSIWDAKENTFESGERVYGGSRSYPLAYKKGVWMDWVVHVKWSYEIDGVLEIWVDGVQVVNQTGPNCFHDKNGPTWQMGVYEWAWKIDPPLTDVTRRVVYYDEYRIGGATSCYQDVAPGISANAEDSTPPSAPKGLRIAF